MPTQKNPQNRVEVAHTVQPVTEHTAIDSAHRVVNVCAVAIRNRDGLVLTVRKQGSDGFMMPGGKPDPGETPLGAAVREVTEELGFAPDPARMVHLGTFQAPALNENGYTVRAETYEYLPHPSEYEVLAALTPHAEIAELRWVDPAQNRDATQAPLNIECIFPVLSAHPR